ncbi:MAG: hypothetical protein H0W43_04590 [Chthoniobacterales bacterium]|nr:hypothetical protein [Chthoniobacterales bacterium]
MKIRLSLFILAGFLLLSARAAERAAEGLLDGTAWTVQAVPTVETSNKGAKRFDDVLTFAGGKVSSQELQRSGIGPVAYTATGTKDFMNWETVPVLQAKGKAQWDGVIKEQDIKGNLKWVTSSGEVRYYFINGKKR